MKEGEDGELLTKLPVYEQKPNCGLTVSYEVTGTKSWINYDSKEHNISIKRKSAVNGKYQMSV